MTAPREFEIALIVRSETPLEIVSRIAALTSIDGYRLHQQPSLSIRDLYFDTTARALAARRIALRVRTIGSLRLLTVKGESRRTEWGAVDRFEIEDAWSPTAPDRIIDTLRRAGVPLARAVDPTADPVEALTALGLCVIQDRETQRHPRNVSQHGDPVGAVLAELAIDAVAYRFDARTVRMYEVEIEAKSSQGASEVRAIMECLLTRFAPALRPWPYGKLTTGTVVDRLLGEGALEGLLGQDETLSATGLDRVESILTERAAGSDRD